MAETDLWFGTLSATVRVEDLPASRQVVAIERQANGDWRVCGQAVSSAEGIATLPITGLPTSRIYAIAIDEWGKPFAPGMTVAYGDVIRPTQFRGWMYQVTAPGEMPSTEPDWWNSMAGVPQPVGTAMMQAVRHYQPIAHGPVGDIEWMEMEFDPYWDGVVALLHFDGDLVDETGRVWTLTGGATTTPSDPIYGTGSLLCNGLTDSASTPNPIGSTTDPFTIETAFVLTDLLGPINSAGQRRTALWGQPNDSADGEYGLRVIDGLLALDLRGGTASHGIHYAEPIAWEVGTKYHVAHSFDGAHHRIYLDGKKVIEVELSIGWKNTTQNFSLGMLYVPRYSSTRNGSFAKFDELRITKGVARYIENFDPPTAPFPNVGPPL